MATADRKGIWSGGEAYEHYVGRWSRLVAREFLAWLAVSPGSRWLDVGCGTGALSETILKTTAPADVTGVDPSDGFLALARERVTDPRARFVAGDARAIPIASGTCHAVVAGLVLNFVPEPAVAVAEMSRVARRGGRVGAYVWDYAVGMELMRRFWDAATALDPAAAEKDEGQRFDTVCSPEALASLWLTAGLSRISTRPVDVPTRFRDFDDYWTPFLGGQGPGPAYVATLETEHREALRERLRADLPTAADGSIPLVARAWAVRGAR